MNSIVVAIPTYKRPEMLERLIRSIIACHIDPALIRDVRILVVDNDVNQSGENVVLRLQSEYSGKYAVHYRSYSVKGLSNVRNEMLRCSYELQPDFIVFIDDDEYVSPEWLNELVRCIVTTEGQLCRGPVFADFAGSVSDEIACWFQRENYPDGFELSSLTTGNLIMKRTALQEYDVWFDLRFNTTGSEDSHFGMQLQKKGARIYWAANAAAFETIPPERSTLRWLVRRSYRVAGTYAYLLKSESKYLRLLKKVLVSFFYIFVGLLASIFTFLPVKQRYRGVLMVAEGLGGLSGVFNCMYGEYK